MEGKKQESRTENFIEKTNTTVVVSRESAKEIVPPVSTDPTVLKDLSMTSLEAILPNISGCKEEWPQKALAAVIERYGRMPRNGWTTTRA